MREDLPPSWDVAVVGAGAAGLFAAMLLARAGKRVAVLERNAESGKKLLQTGGGRCNLARDLPPREMADAFGVARRFVSPAFHAMPLSALRETLAEAGIGTKTMPDGGVYPASESAREVRDKLEEDAKRHGARFFFSRRVKSILLDNFKAASGVEPADGERIAARAVLLCGGGAARPATGSDGSLLGTVHASGIPTVPFRPALSPLPTRENRFFAIAGSSLADARLWVEGATKADGGTRGSLLFTKTGLSGPAALDLSAAVSQRVAETGGPAILRLRAEANADENIWRERLRAGGRTEGKTAVKNFLARTGLPKGFSEVLCAAAGVAGETAMAQLARTDAQRLAEALGGLPVTCDGPEGNGIAMLSRGGIAREAVDAKTMAVKAISGLYAAGEMLDADGPTGGYNLFWAFASAALAARSCARR
ncbi:MAG: aminoacetone oxidase family FAD-binding enzyme [Kiritimatiellae bacterium]|nr:aminoacetone oxidase family FAD-binding enzyme [Kiritimatiellia bacterium]